MERHGPRVFVLLVTWAMSLGLGSSGSRAARPEPMIANKTDADDALRRFRLSTVTLRTNATAISFDRGAEQTWNPTVGMNLDLSPRYWFSDKLSLALGIDLSGDLTENDLTTYRNEVWLGDTRAVLIARDFATIPGIDVTMSASLGVTLPTSKWSIGEGLIMSVGPSIRLGRAFPDVLGGLNIGYSARFAKNFHRYTTSELATPRIPGCLPGAAANCDSFTHTGVRNVSYRLAHGLDVSLGLADWCFISLELSAFVTWLHDGIDDPRISLTPQEPTNVRHFFFGDLGVSFLPWSPLEVRLGINTFAPQLAPDSTHYLPGLNRFTTIYIDLRFDVAGVMSALR